MKNVLRGLSLVVVLALVACAAVQQQKTIAARADEGRYHNLRVLPQNVTHDELIAAMRSYSRALSVKCDHCHVENPAGSAEHFDFASDAKSEKNVARVMMVMTRRINTETISKVNEHGVVVTCMTCHRGQTVPDSTPVAEPAAPKPKA